MKDDVPFQDYAVYTEKTGGRGKGIAILFFILLLIAATALGLYFLGRNSQSGSSIATPTQSPTTPPKPTATPTPVLDRKELRVSVLNGSGVPGAANNISSVLRELGYVVGATANADKFTYTGVTIQVSEDKKEYADLLKKDLEEKASASAITATVSADLNTDAVVIVGK